MIFLLFKPLNIKTHKFVDVPLFEVNYFNLYELSTKGLNTIMTGSNAIKYSDRYVVKNIDYTDNSKSYIANMSSKSGIYKNNVVTLSNNVEYSREDGLNFNSDQLIYNKDTHIALVNSNYVISRKSNIIKGSYLKYNNLLDTIESKNVSVKYELKEKSI